MKYDRNELNEFTVFKISSKNEYLDCYLNDIFTVF